MSKFIIHSESIAGGIRRRVVVVNNNEMSPSGRNGLNKTFRTISQGRGTENRWDLGHNLTE